jgi:hypothetical protein
VFLSSLTYSGDLKTAGGGQTALDSADKLCQHLADAAVIGGVWKAWLSDSTTNAIDRITEGPWYLLTYAGAFGNIEETYETRAFNNKANLTTVPLSAININEFGRSVSSSNGVLYVWTGTTGSATAGVETCSNWTSSAASDHGIMGTAGGTIVGWTDSPEWGTANGSPVYPLPCNESAHLYCFEQ